MKKAIFCIGLFIAVWLFACNEEENSPVAAAAPVSDTLFTVPDTADIPKDKFGDMVRYGRQLMIHTSYYIGPKGVNGQYLGNQSNCTNCHRDAGTKEAAFNLMLSHSSYPQYRAREGKVLTLAERVNNCVMRPHSGKPLPLDSKEMVAILSYLKWINSTVKNKKARGFSNLEVSFPQRAADPEKGAVVYNSRCMRCHGANGEGQENVPGSPDHYLYPPVWGAFSYQPGSSMHRIIKMAGWLKANMPYDSAASNKVVLSDADALDVAAFINDDRIHSRPNPKSLDYPNPEEKAIDYGHGPFSDPFSEVQHKFGPYQPIIDYRKSKGMKVSF